MQHQDALKAAFQETLGLPPDVDWNSVAYAVTPGWDSVAHMSLIAAIENKFDIMLDTDSVIDMSSFQKAVEILSNHGVPV
jgi:acyl carrier protein